MARRMISEEGLFVGGTSGSTLYAAIEWGKQNNLTENDRVVIICADHLRNYLTKYLSNEWLCEKGVR